MLEGHALNEWAGQSISDSNNNNKCTNFVFSDGIKSKRTTVHRAFRTNATLPVLFLVWPLLNTLPDFLEFMKKQFVTAVLFLKTI